jgi:hypothetical protein
MHTANFEKKLTPFQHFFLQEEEEKYTMHWSSLTHSAHHCRILFIIVAFCSSLPHRFLIAAAQHCHGLAMFGSTITS